MEINKDIEDVNPEDEKKEHPIAMLYRFVAAQAVAMKYFEQVGPFLENLHKQAVGENIEFAGYNRENRKKIEKILESEMDKIRRTHAIYIHQNNALVRPFLDGATDFEYIMEMAGRIREFTEKEISDKKVEEIAKKSPVVRAMLFHHKK